MEAKRAVPRSEQPREIGGTTNKFMSPTNNKYNNYNINNSSGNMNVDEMMSEMNNMNLTPGKGPINFNSNDYEYHKIFVGGLHYDTRDGKYY